MRLFRPTVTQEDLDHDNRCLVNPEKHCSDLCKKWMSTKCNGAKLIRKGSTDTYMWRSSFGFEEKTPDLKEAVK